jgi:hypothetical protein
MNVCPVCEAPAQSRVCEVCGHAFAAEVTPPPLVERLEDLDAPATVNGPTPVAPLSDLEPTRFAPADIPAEWSEVEWERSAFDKAPDVTAGGLSDMDTGREEASAERTPASVGPAPCRYCRHVQETGLMCDVCGMRLPRNLAVAPSVGAVLDPDILIRCPLCGERTYQRARCLSCGGSLSREG